MQFRRLMRIGVTTVSSALLAVAIFAQATPPPQQASPATAPPAQQASASTETFAGATLVGTVTSGGTPLPGVAVTITDPSNGQRIGTSTGDNGQFQQRVGHPGSYMVTVEMTGFAQNTSTVNVSAEGPATVPVQVEMVLASRAPPPPPPPAPAPTAPGQPAPVAPPPPPPPPPSITASAGRGFQNVGVQGSNAALSTQDIEAEAQGENQALQSVNGDTATESVDVNGGMAQVDQTPLSSTQLQTQMQQMGMPGGPGNPGGGPGGPGGAGGGPGGPGGRGGGGPGGFGGGGRGGFGGRGPFTIGGRGGANRFNQWHGNIAYTLGDSALNAEPFSVNGAPVVQPSAFNETFNFNATGPLEIPHLYNSHGKTIIFLTTRFTDNSAISNQVGTVPTAAEQTGDFNGIEEEEPTTVNGQTVEEPTQVTVTNPCTGTPFVNNTITGNWTANSSLPASSPCNTLAGQSFLSPVATALMKYYPLPNVATAASTGIIENNYESDIATKSENEQITLRVNHSLNAKMPGSGQYGGRGFGGRGASINFSFGYSNSNTISPALLPIDEGYANTKGINTSIGLNYPVWGGWIDNATIGYNRSYSRDLGVFAYAAADPAAEAGITGVSPDAIDYGLPTLSFSTSGISSLSTVAPSYIRAQTWTFSDGLVKRIGKHAIRWGGDFRRIQNNPEIAPNPNGTLSFTGAVTGYDLADFLLGQTQEATQKYGAQVFYLRQDSIDGYMQDNWQVRGNLTLNYGVRYEYLSPYSSNGNQLANLVFSPGWTDATVVTEGTAGQPQDLLKPDPYGIRPNIGVAWRTWEKLVFRFGFGMNYNTQAYSTIAQQMAEQPPFYTNITATGTSTAPLNIASPFVTGTAIQNSYAVDPDYRMGVVNIWNADVQRQIGQVWVVNIDYTGTKGSDLDEIMAPNRTPTGLLNTAVVPFEYESYGGKSLGEIGTLIVSRRLSKSISFRTTYTYEKLEDDATSIATGGGASSVIAQNPDCLSCEWGLSSFNRTNQFNASYLWQLPFGLNHRWMDTTNFWSSAFGDWMVSGSFVWETGTPLTPLISGNALQTEMVYGELRPNLTGEPVALSSPTPVPGTNAVDFFNPNAFVNPNTSGETTLIYGDAGRDSIIGPGTVNLNMQLNKDFRFSEYKTLDIDFAATNALNHVNYSQVGTTYGTATFGEVTQAGAMRAITFTARYRF